MKELLFVCAGGGLGSGARYLVGIAFRHATGDGFPWGTLTVNVIGSFLLGFLLMHAAGADRLSPTTELALGTGLLGGFTTYSTFNFETVRLAQQGEPGKAALYVVLTVLAGLAAGVGGIALGRSLAT
jgi:CrcB protein